MVPEEFYIKALEQADNSNKILLAILVLLGIIFAYKVFKDLIRG